MTSEIPRFFGAEIGRSIDNHAGNLSVQIDTIETICTHFETEQKYSTHTIVNGYTLITE